MFKAGDEVVFVDIDDKIPDETEIGYNWAREECELGEVCIVREVRPTGNITLQGKDYILSAQQFELAGEDNDNV